MPCGVDVGALHPGRPGRAADARPVPARGGVPARRAQGDRRRRRRARGRPRRRAARRGRSRRRGARRATPRRAGCARSPPSTASPTGCVLHGRVGRDAMPALLRSADAVVCAPVVRAVRDRPAGGDGLRRAGGRHRRRRPDRLGRRRRDRRARPAARPGRARRDAPRAARRPGAARARSARPAPAARASASARPDRGRHARRLRRRAGRRASPPSCRASRRVLASDHAPPRGAGRRARATCTRTRCGSSAGATRLATVLTGGGRLLAAGNGGSAAQAQHLTAELVGRYRDDRPPLSAIPLCVEPSAVTAIGNDYGIEEIFARQVRGARPSRRRARCCSRRPAARRTSSPPRRAAREAG